jgi:hypothetical protein
VFTVLRSSAEIELGGRNNHHPGRNAANERSALISGLELSRQLHGEVIAPVLARRFPHVRYASARLDSGSDVLGFDTPVSRDHGWGPRVTVFLGQDDLAAAGTELRAVLAEALPAAMPALRPDSHDQPRKRRTHLDTALK